MAKVLYYNCDWGGKGSPTAWLSKKPCKDAIQLGSVKWRGTDVTIEIMSVGGGKLEIDKKAERSATELYALLKSNLQKQVRRQRDSAVATAARLWELGEFELLRRLVIIAAEDTDLSQETAVVNWLMTARSKGLLLGEHHRRWVLGYVSSLVKDTVCRRFEIDTTSSSKLDLSENLHVQDVLKSDHPDCEQLAAILFRAAYGGLKCDPPMLTRCVDWYLKSKTPLQSTSIKEWTELIPAGMVVINPAAIDFHIWPGLLGELQKLHPQYSKDHLQRVIWECISGYNKRFVLQIDGSVRETLLVVKKDLRILVTRYLNNIIKKYNGL